MLEISDLFARFDGCANTHFLNLASLWLCNRLQVDGAAWRYLQVLFGVGVRHLKPAFQVRHLHFLDSIQLRLKGAAPSFVVVLVQVEAAEFDVVVVALRYVLLLELLVH